MMAIIDGCHDSWWAIIDGCHSYLSAFLFLETSFPLFIAELESQQLSLWINDLFFTNGGVGPVVVGDNGDHDDDDVGNDDDGDNEDADDGDDSERCYIGVVKVV